MYLSLWWPLINFQTVCGGFTLRLWWNTASSTSQICCFLFHPRHNSPVSPRWPHPCWREHISHVVNVVFCSHWIYISRLLDFSNELILPYFKKWLLGAGNGSASKNACSSSRITRFGFQHSHWGVYSFETSVLESLMPSSGCRYCMYVIHTEKHTYA